MSYKYNIGEIFINRNNQEFEIIGMSDKKQYRKIRFIKSGYECDLYMCKTSIDSAYDYGSPTIHGVGIVGFKGARTHPLYNRWVDMISRVHNPIDINYHSYGGRGVTIDEDWYQFKNYIRDISSKDNYDKLINDSKNWSIDKDLNDSMVYNNENTIIITKVENSRERMERNPIVESKEVFQFDTNGNLINKYESARTASKSTGVGRDCIGGCCRGKQRTAGGFIWKYVNQ